MRARQTAIVLSANKYSFNDDKTNKLIEGCGVYYILTEKLAPYFDEERSSKGYKPIKATLPSAIYDKIGEVPGLYNLDFDFQASSDGKFKGIIVDFEFVEPLVKPGV